MKQRFTISSVGTSLIIHDLVYARPRGGMTVTTQFLYSADSGCWYYSNYDKFAMATLTNGKQIYRSARRSIDKKKLLAIVLSGLLI